MTAIKKIRNAIKTNKVFIDYNDKSVMVFEPNKLPEVKYNNDKLPVLNVLADLQITPTDIFSLLKL